MEITVNKSNPQLNVKTKADVKTKTAHNEYGYDAISQVQALKQKLDDLHNNLNNLVDPILIDSCLYEIMAVNLRFEYYIKLCKEMNISHSVSFY